MPIKNFDGYYDPPDVDEGPCAICHHSVDECFCPECDICGVFGDPKCINTHMPWDKWGHFKFQRTERELKVEQAFEEQQRKAEEKLEKWLNDPDH